MPLQATCWTSLLNGEWVRIPGNHTHGVAARLRCLLSVALVTVYSSTALSVQLRVATFNIENGPGSVGTISYNAVRDILLRVDADVVAFQEWRSGDLADLAQLAIDTGYGVTALGDIGDCDLNLRHGYFSRFPITDIHHVMSPSGAADLVRSPTRVVVAVPGAANPLVFWNMHHKAGDGSDDEFRRAVEAIRIMDNIDDYLAANPSHDEFLVLGDMNDDDRDFQTIAFTSLPGGLPACYDLGADIGFPVPYATFPTDHYGPPGFGLFKIEAFQEDTVSPVTRPVSGRQLDYIFVSDAIKGSGFGPPQGEIYSSIQDDGIGGLPKSGVPLPAATSAEASDHLLVFADVHMDDDLELDPDGPFFTAGDEGGPFFPAAETYTLSNPNPAGMAWSVNVNVDWLDLSTTGGVLSSGSATGITVSVNANADTLPQGTHLATVQFDDLSNARTAFRDVDLRVNIPPFLTVAPDGEQSFFGPVGGPFSPPAHEYTVGNGGDLPLSWEIVNTVDWHTVSSTAGALDGMAGTVVTSALSSAASALPEGVYASDLVFTNTTTGNAEVRRLNLFVGERDLFTEQFSASDNDLAYVKLTFTPDASADFYTLCREGVAAFPADPAGGTPLFLFDDDTQLIDVGLGSNVLLYGVAYNAFFVNSNGSITFDHGDTDFQESLADHFAAPRISMLFDDLNPSAGGAISWQQLPDRVVVTYVDVPEFFSTGRNSFQVEMGFDGRIGITYLNRTAADGMVGLSAGGGIPAGFVESDLSASSLCAPTAPAQMAVVPNESFDAEGDEGGPFSPATVLYNVVNLGGQALDWEVTEFPSWLSLLTPGAGVLSGAQSTPVTLAVNGGATLLDGALYTGTVDIESLVDTNGNVMLPASLLVRDGIPDAWRTLHFGHPEPDNADLSRAEDDRDGDGHTNLHEYYFDTDPLLDTDFFTYTITPLPGDVIAIGFTASSARSYRLEFSDTLLGIDPWSAVSDFNGVAGINGIMTYEDDGSGTGAPPVNAPARSYRIQVILPPQ